MPFNRWYFYCLFFAVGPFIAFIAEQAVKESVVKAYRIPSAGMVPTLEIGDHIFVDKLSYGIRNPITGLYLARCTSPQRRDIVVFIFPEERSKLLVQRVMGLPGETIEIRDKKILINGKLVDDSHANFYDSDFQVNPSGLSDKFGPKTIPKDRLFLLGDNRDRSYDSRFWGYVHTADVRGRIRGIYWSWNGAVRWERVGEIVR
jgi:signal peptidase I